MNNNPLNLNNSSCTFSVISFFVFIFIYFIFLLLLTVNNYKINTKVSYNKTLMQIIIRIHINLQPEFMKINYVFN